MWPSPGTPATQTPSPTTSSNTEPKGRTASSRRWTASPPPATASGACTPTRSTKSECRPSIASARGRRLLGWRPAQESRLRPVLHETSRPTLFHRTQWWSAGRSRRSPMDRWDERWSSSLFLIFFSRGKHAVFIFVGVLFFQTNCSKHAGNYLLQNTFVLYSVLNKTNVVKDSVWCDSSPNVHPDDLKLKHIKTLTPSSVSQLQSASHKVTFST